MKMQDGSARESRTNRRRRVDQCSGAIRTGTPAPYPRTTHMAAHAPESLASPRQNLRVPSKQGQALLYTTWWALETHHARVRRVRRRFQGAEKVSEEGLLDAETSSSRPEDDSEPHGGRVLLQVHRRTSMFREESVQVAPGTEAPYSWKMAAFFYRALEATKIEATGKRTHALLRSELVNLLLRAELDSIRSDRGPRELQAFLAAARQRWPYLALTAAQRIDLYEHFYVTRVALWLHVEREKHWRAGHTALECAPTRGYTMRLTLLDALLAVADAEAARTLASLQQQGAEQAAQAAPNQPGGTWKASARPADAVQRGISRRYPRLDVEASSYMLEPLWADPFSTIKHEALAWIWRDTRPAQAGRAPRTRGPSGHMALDRELAALAGCSFPSARGDTRPQAADEPVVPLQAVQHAFHTVLHQTLLMMELDDRARTLFHAFEQDAHAHMMDIMPALLADFRSNLSVLTANAHASLDQCTTYIMQYFVFLHLGEWAQARARLPSPRKTAELSSASPVRSLVTALVDTAPGDGPAPEADVGPVEDAETAHWRAEFAYLAEHLARLTANCRQHLQESLQMPTRAGGAQEDSADDDAAASDTDEPHVVPALTRTLSSYILVAQKRQMLAGSQTSKDVDDTPTEATTATTSTTVSGSRHSASRSRYSSSADVPPRASGQSDESDESDESESRSPMPVTDHEAPETPAERAERRRQMHLIRTDSRRELDARRLRTQQILAQTWTQGRVRDTPAAESLSHSESSDRTHKEAEETTLVLGEKDANEILTELGFFTDPDEESTASEQGVAPAPPPASWNSVDRRAMQQEDEEVLRAHDAAMRARTYHAGYGRRRASHAPSFSNHQPLDDRTVPAPSTAAAVTSPRRKSLFGSGPTKARKMLKRATTVRSRSGSSASGGPRKPSKKDRR